MYVLFYFFHGDVRLKSKEQSNIYRMSKNGYISWARQHEGIFSPTKNIETVVLYILIYIHTLRTSYFSFTNHTYSLQIKKGCKPHETIQSQSTCRGCLKFYWSHVGCFKNNECDQRLLLSTGNHSFTGCTFQF